MKKENIDNYMEREKLLKKLEYNFINDLVSIRRENHMSQQQLANSSNVIRETIARIENLMTSPQLNTLIKILEPMGYTIKIEPLVKTDDDSK